MPIKPISPILPIQKVDSTDIFQTRAFEQGQSIQPVMLKVEAEQTNDQRAEIKTERTQIGLEGANKLFEKDAMPDQPQLRMERPQQLTVPDLSRVAQVSLQVRAPYLERTIDMLDRGDKVQDVLEDLEQSYETRQQSLEDIPNSRVLEENILVREGHESTMRAEYISEQQWMPKEGSDQDRRMIPVTKDVPGVGQTRLEKVKKEAFNEMIDNHVQFEKRQEVIEFYTPAYQSDSQLTKLTQKMTDLDQERLDDMSYFREVSFDQKETPVKERMDPEVDFHFALDQNRGMIQETMDEHRFHDDRIYEDLSAIYQDKVDRLEASHYELEPIEPPEPPPPELFATLPLLDTKNEAYNRQLEKEDKGVQVEVYRGREKEEKKDTTYFDYRSLEEKGPYRLKSRRDILHTPDNRKVRVMQKNDEEIRMQLDLEETESQRHADIKHMADNWQPSEKTDNPNLKALQKDLNL